MSESCLGVLDSRGVGSVVWPVRVGSGSAVSCAGEFIVSPDGPSPPQLVSGADILRPSHSPSSQQIGCDTLQPFQYAITTPTQKPGKAALTYNASQSRYQYLWETDASWVGTCRQLIVTLNDGTQHRASFQFVAGDDQE
jgi:hypothetical protein